MPEQALSLIGTQAVATRFSGYHRLTVRQQKRWLEILVSFEAKNSYDVYDETQTAVLNASEVDSGFLRLILRLFLGPYRPFDMVVTDLHTGEIVLRLHRPWRWIFHRLEVRAGNGELLGAIEKRWSWVRRIYGILDSTGHEVATLFGPFLKPWTFELKQNNVTVGVVRKRWSGFGKELFTDADNFGVELDNVSDPLLKSLAFAATVLVDVVHFERSKSN